MASITQEIRERVAAIKGALKVGKSVVTAVQALNRLGRRLVSRRRSLPDEKDLMALLEALKKVVSAANEITKLPSIFDQVWRL